MWEPNTTYFDDANRETFIVAQIETLEAVENVKAIAAVPGIDCQRAPWGGDFALMNALKRCSERVGWRAGRRSHDAKAAIFKVATL